MTTVFAFIQLHQGKRRDHQKRDFAKITADHRHRLFTHQKKGKDLPLSKTSESKSYLDPMDISILEAMLTGGIEFNLSAIHTDLQSKNLENGKPKIAARQVSSQRLRIQIREEVEIHWRSDTPLPQTNLEYQRFLQEVEDALKKCNL